MSRRTGQESGCPYCGDPWRTSTGPGRVVGAAAYSLRGINAPLPDDLSFEYCGRCSIRNMTPELIASLHAAERAYMSRLNPHES